MKLKNFKMFRDVVVKDIPMLAVFVGANGSGKSTLFEGFGFIQDALIRDIPYALEKHGGFKELRTRGGKGAIEIGIRAEMKVSGKDQLVDYSLRIEGERVEREAFLCGPVSPKGEASAPALVYESNAGVSRSGKRQVSLRVAATAALRAGAGMKQLQLAMNEQNLALKFLGLVKGLGAVSAFREGVENWHLSNFRVDAAHADARAGSERLSASGDNLAAVAQFLEKKHPERFGKVLEKVAERIPGIARVSVESAPDNRVALKFHDRAWMTRPFPARHMSEGAIKALAYLILLNEPAAHSLLCVEEPENQLYPTLLVELLEEFRGYAKWENAQVFVTTHSPDLLDAAETGEVFWLSKKKGAAIVHRAKDVAEIVRKMDRGHKMGHLWRIGEFEGAKP